MNNIPHVVYHVACMGGHHWIEVVREQFELLRQCGLADALASIGDKVNITHLGNHEHLKIIVREAELYGIPINIVRTDPNTDHYETFAMIEIERLAKEEKTTRPILYMHTKGVSNPGEYTKVLWRRTMGNYVVSKWKENIEILNNGHDAAGFNWWERGEQHFSGTFWIATADWIRRLPNYVQYHHLKKLERFSAELWIGAAQFCKAHSWGTKNAFTWVGNFDWSPHLPPARAFVTEASKETITWVSAATVGYLGDLNRLQQSFENIGPGHQLQTYVIPNVEKWRHCEKLKLMKRALKSVDSSHVFWIDADCQFMHQILVSELIDPNKPLSAVRHFLYNEPKDGLPDDLLARIPNVTQNYWQACVWGGTVDEVAKVLDRVSWIYDNERGYDEHALNIDFQSNPNNVNTLACQYAMPESFAKMPGGALDSYKSRATGHPKILHYNREIART